MKSTFTPGQRLQINGESDFFRLLATTSPVTIDFYYQGREIAERQEVEAGFAEQFRTIQFDRVDIVSPLAQTVQWETALGSEIRYDRGAASITGTVGLDAATLAALERPDQQTGFFSSSAGLTANVAEQIFSPASNVNGAIVLSADAYIRESTGAFNAMTLITKASAPATIIDCSILAMSRFTVEGASFSAASLTLPKEQFVAAGQGLYFIVAGGVSGAHRGCRFRLL